MRGREHVVPWVCEDKQFAKEMQEAPGQKCPAEGTGQDNAEDYVIYMACMPSANPFSNSVVTGQLPLV